MRIDERIAAGTEPSFSFEFFPPKTEDGERNLAEALRALGDFAGARRLHEQALEGYRRVLGDEHPVTLTSLNNLAATLWGQGDLVGARGLHEQALELYRRVLGA
jgi:tetratricopeptide (TPR) repeat protein